MTRILFLCLAALVATAGLAHAQSQSPWADVKSGANGCPAAVGNGSEDDHLAIQCQVNYMDATRGGGVVYLPCGTYSLNGNTLVDTDGTVTLQGENRACTAVVNNTDVTTILFPARANGGGYGGVRDLQVVGYLNSAATQAVVVVGNGAAVFIYDVSVIGGTYGLLTSGVDGTVQNSYIAGYQGGVFSNGANWYVRVKLDGPVGGGVAASYGYYQAAYWAPGIGENHFVHCDFSAAGGAGWTLAANIDATASNTVTTFEGSVFGLEVAVQAGVAMFSGDEFGSSTFLIAPGATVSASGNYALNGLTITNAGTLKCSGNVGISNAGC